MRYFQQDGRWARVRKCCAYIILALAFLVVWSRLINTIGSKPDGNADGYSEANAIRAADAYLTEGFTAHHGLPRIIYGSRLPRYGSAGDARFFGGTIPEPRNEYAYLHYPPGPDYIVAASVYFLGLPDTRPLRWVPVAFSLAAVLMLAITVDRLRGGIWGLATGAVLLAVPIFLRLGAGLHCQGYTVAALLIAIAILLDAFLIRGRLLWGHALALAALGFLQGWLSFDSFFIATFTPIPLWMLARGSGKTAKWRPLVIAIVLSGGAFGFAHFLHLLQVSAELGSFQAGLHELLTAAKTRAGSLYSPNLETAGFGPNTGYLQFIPVALREYAKVFLDPWRDVHTRETFGFALVAMAAAFIAMHVVGSGTLGTRRKWHITAALAAGFISLAWALAMPQHAIVHAAFTARHFMLMYLVMWLSLAICCAPSPASKEPESAPLEAQSETAA